MLLLLAKWCLLFILALRENQDRMSQGTKCSRYKDKFDIFGLFLILTEICGMGVRYVNILSEEEPVLRSSCSAGWNSERLLRGIGGKGKEFIRNSFRVQLICVFCYHLICNFCFRSKIHVVQISDCP